MANKGAISGTSKADIAISNVQKDIRQMEKRDWLTISERSILESKEREKPTVSQIRISQYNPDSPLKGSKFWSKEQWDSYKAKVRADKKAAKNLNK
jgi:hypothetical protein